MVLLQTGHSRWSKSEIMDRQIHEIGWDSLTSDRFRKATTSFFAKDAASSRKMILPWKIALADNPWGSESHGAAWKGQARYETSPRANVSDTDVRRLQPSLKVSVFLRKEQP